jgi:hypothetical protein
MARMGQDVTGGCANGADLFGPIGGAAAPSPETEGAAFFRESDLPELSTARVTPAQIARLFEH